MFAVVAIAGFQEMLREGDKLNVPLQATEKGGNITFDQVVLLSDGDDLKIGSPFLSGASVEAKVLEHGRDEKIRVFKMRRRKRYRRTHGHRQDFTTIEVVKINAGK